MAKKTSKRRAKKTGSRSQGELTATTSSGPAAIKKIEQDYIPIAGGVPRYVYVTGENFARPYSIEFLDAAGASIGQVVDDEQELEGTTKIWALFKINANVPAGADKLIRITTPNGADTNDPTNPAEQFKTA